MDDNNKDRNNITSGTSKQQTNPLPSGGAGGRAGAAGHGPALLNFPNALTCCNLISGCVATCFAFFHSPALALTWIIIGAVFDFFDGMSARALGIASPIGKELDSLADDVTFGVAPSTIIFSQLIVMDFGSVPGFVADYVPFLAYVMAGFSALRLAKFNLDARQSMGFIGLPTPANAMFWGSLIISLDGWINSFTAGPWIVIALMLVSCYLLISEIPMFALKFKHWGWSGNELRYSYIVASALIIVGSTVAGAMTGAGVGTGFLSAWWVVILLYVVVSIVDDLKKK